MPAAPPRAPPAAGGGLPDAGELRGATRSAREVAMAVGLGLGWTAATAALGAVLFGHLGYRSLLQAGVIGTARLPQWLHGEVADAAFIGAATVLAWQPWRPLRVVAAGLLWLVVGLLGVQALSLHLSAGWLSPQAMAHAGLAPMLITPTTAAVAVGLPTLVTLSLIFGGRRLITLPAAARIAVAAALAGFGWWALSPERVDAALPGASPARAELVSKYRLVQGSPLAAIARTGWAMAVSGPVRHAAPAPASLKTAAKWGLVVRPGEGLPFVRDHITKAPLPFPRRPEAPKKPNVIVIFAESFSAHMLEPYGAPHAGLTPNLSAMAKRAMVVDEWFNHVTPTVTGLRGQLCGLYPKLTWTPWVKAKQKPKTGVVYCLPHLLAEHGWRTLYWSHVKPHVTYLKAQSLDWGFTEPSFHKEVTEPWIGEQPIGPGYGATDRQMMRALTRFVQAEHPKPFFLALSTVETHTGFSLGPDGEGYRRPGGEPAHALLDVFHNFDDAFGDFWRAFLASPRAKDTIVIVTADHALYPSDDHRAVAGPGYLGSKFSRVAMMVYDPTHALPKRWRAGSTSVDFAPTLAHLLHLPQRRVPWLGWSIFGDRQRFRGALGFIYSDKLLTIDKGGPKLDAEVGAEAKALREVLGYTQTIEEQGLIWLK